METITKLSQLRCYMQQHKLDTIIIPSSDPHMSEYLPDHWKFIAWFSGFTGSAGTLVITNNHAGLWTDSRYYTQAEEQLQGSGIDLFKEGLEETPSITNYLINNLNKGANIAVWGELISITQYTNLKSQLTPFNIITDLDPIQAIWSNRPSLPLNKVEIYSTVYCGESAHQKTASVQENYIDSEQAFIISSLEEIAWLLNIRGTDIRNNPVVISYLIVEKSGSTLFIDSSKLEDDTIGYLGNLNIKIEPYTAIFTYLNQLNKEIILDPQTTNKRIFDAIKTPIIQTNSPIARLKSLKNKTQIKNIKKAMIKDGVAMVNFLMWLEKNIDNGITEIDIANKLNLCRSLQGNFKGESFDTIAGYKEHAAIVHYAANEHSNYTLQKKGSILIDSGAQYLEGTTDITRTIALGDLSEQESIDYSLVLKGHINLAKAIFPKGTRGSQLDILARLPLWEHKKNYLHGTGHGVGQYLSVHEGPQSIRMQENSTQLEEGMVISNEPGVYIPNSHGVRIENLILVTTSGEGLLGSYLQFETISLCPICTKGIKKELLNYDEIEWLNSYHKKVFNQLSPYLEKEQIAWLKDKTNKI